MPWLIIAGALAGLGLVAVLSFASVYNRLVRLKNQCNNGFSQIEIQLKRRYDLVPNLVECVKGYLTHERECLVKVAEARNQAAAGLREAIARPEDAGALAKWMGAEGALAQELGKLSVVMESYPDLKANTAVADLTEQLTSTENRIAYARQAYNDWATGFNDYRETFPVCIFAGSFGFADRRSMIEFADAHQIAVAPSVALV